MANFNKVILAGNLTRDPQLSYLPSNTPVCEFGMAVNRKWRSKEGEMREDTCFVDLRSYGKPAETLNQYMAKGRPLLVEGHLKLDQWEAKDGGRRSKLYVIVDTFQFLGAPPGGGRGGYRQDASDAPPPAASVAPRADEMPPPATNVAPAMDEMPPPRGPEEVPF